MQCLAVRAVLVALVLAAALRSPFASADPPASQPASRSATTERAGGYKLSAGPYKAAEHTLVLHDEVRKADVPIRVRYPRDAGESLPVVVFSHGMGGSDSAFPELTTHWATHGYVVILPTHSDSIRLRRQRGQATPRSIDELRDPRQLRNVDPIGRRDDVSLIVDSLDKIEAAIPALRRTDGGGRLDRSRLGISGHSAGAYTTQLVIGVKARVRGAGERATLADERFKAAIVISGQGLTHRALTRDSWSGVRKPMLVIAGSRDTSPVSNETPASRRHPYEFAPPGDKYLLFLEGATHASYSGKSLTRLLNDEPVKHPQAIVDAVAAQTLAFWDAYLKNDATARTYLAEDAIEKLHPIVDAEHK